MHTLCGRYWSQNMLVPKYARWWMATSYPSHRAVALNVGFGLGPWLYILALSFPGSWASFFTYLALLSHFSRVRLCATPSLGFSRQEHWSGLPLPSPVHESEKWKWSRSVMSDYLRPHGCSLPGSSFHGIFQARVLEWGAIAFSALLSSKIKVIHTKSRPYLPHTIVIVIK